MKPLRTRKIIPFDKKKRPPADEWAVPQKKKLDEPDAEDEPSPEKKRLGRPIKLDNPETRERLVELIGKGIPNIHACGAVGITPTTFHAYRQRHEWFAEELAAAIARGVEARLRKIEAASDAGDWRAASWLLEHCQPEHFAKTRVQVEAVGQFDHSFVIPRETLDQIAEARAKHERDTLNGVHATEVAPEPREARNQFERVMAKEMALHKLMEPIEYRNLIDRLAATEARDPTTPAICPQPPKAGPTPLDVADPRSLNEKELRQELARLEKLLTRGRLSTDAAKRLETVRKCLAELESLEEDIFGRKRSMN